VKGKGSYCGEDFLTFLNFSLKCREGNPCREAASNALTTKEGKDRKRTGISSMS
jgi:hypothetical protein